jgi:transcriptional regulator with XRE-family HTH domain
MPATTPTVCKYQLGRLVTLLRTRAELTQDEAAKLIRKDRNKIVLLEKAQGSISEEHLDLLLDGFGVDDAELRELMQRLRAGSSQRGRWTGYRAVYPEDFRRFIDFEADAEQIRMVEVEVVPGLLQSEAYMRAMFADRVTAGELYDIVRGRLARQEILHRADPVSLHVVMSESCLHRRWGGHSVMQGQIEHLITLSRKENVLLQVLPFEPPAGRRQASIGSRFMLFRVPSPGLAGPLEVSYTELATDWQYEDDKKALADLHVVWSRLADVALNAQETRTFLRTFAKRF